MRCPKCGSSFQVDLPADARRTGPSPVLGPGIGPADGETSDSRARPPRPPPRPAVARRDKGTLVGVAPAALGTFGAPAKPAAASVDDPYGEVDLPTVGGSRPDPEDTGPPSAPPALSELDLPSLAPARFEQRVPAIAELDLPSPSDARHPARPAPDSIDIDLPASLRPNPLSDFDLPSPARGGFADDGGARSFEFDLPSPSRADLPLRSVGDLPSPAQNLPSRSLGGINLPETAGALPQVARPAATLDSLPPSSSIPPPLDEPGAAFGEFELPPLQLSQIPAPLDGTLQSPGAEPPPGVLRQAGGGVQYGEVNLESSPPAAPSRADSADVAVPAAPSAAPAVPEAAALRSLPTRKQLGEAARPRRRRGLRLALAGIALLVVAGGSLALVPAIGPFGAYWLSDRLKQGDYEQLAAGVVRSAHAQLKIDTHISAREALMLVERARSNAPRARALTAYAAYLGYLEELRFGADSARRARAQVALEELAPQADEEVMHLGLARAARSAVQGQLARARHGAAAVLRAAPGNVDALVLSGELELRAHDPKAALSAWQRAAKLEPGARSSFGLARSYHAAGELERAREHATAALEKSSRHVGSKVLLADMSWRKDRDEKRTLSLLEDVIKQAGAASVGELVQSYTILGDVNLSRSRISRAETAYGEALKIEPKAARALNGLGEALFRAGRYSEALARFEAAAQADPDDLSTKIGVAKTKLLLERVQDASEMLKKLRELQPKSAAVSYWFGQTRESSGDREQAEAAYRAAIEAGGDTEALVDSYLALALLQNQLGRGEEARKLLEQARAKLGNTVAVHKAFAALATQQQQFAAAISAYEQALGIDPEDVGARFRLGVALRRDKRFEQAQRAFEQVARVDRDYPGLALERGLLFEAAGRSEEALKAYEGALARAPNDTDLMLRVGCGKVMAGRPEQAVGLLRKVLSERPNSAETNHCLGRALLLEAKNLAEALRLLERAVELDPHRAEHHLYVGWAANEAGKVGEAERELTLALKLDQSLGDAYWQRGVLRYRQGAVKDAVEDLRRALELSPGRFEAHAALADSLYDLGREQEAMREWEQAVRAQPDNPTWQFRYGKLLAINHKSAEAREHLTRAIETGEKQDAKPRWLWEAHYLLARAIGNAKEAARHWEEFLRQGPRDSPYRGEAKAALERLGRPWRDN
jgi:tetratricopeptide (TPR) repeat protein